MRKITYDSNNFYMDGEKYIIKAGAMHYFRIPAEYWYDRLLKLKECGFNTVETYTEWGILEPREGEFDFSGNHDISRFIKTADELGLNVILRPGPYICAERDFGGLPAWLLKYTDMELRCYDEQFLSKCERYLNRLFDEVRDQFASVGGNIIMLQIENEYGSYGNDKRYLNAIVDIYKKNNIDCLYYTCDGTDLSMLSGGTLDGYLAVANFGSRPTERLGELKAFRPDQPIMSGEYWCGWFDYWNEPHHVRKVEALCEDFEEFLKLGASYNFYLFHGGTNFGFTNGANYFDTYMPTVTSYDYNSPLNEAGDRTPLYYAVRELMEKYYGKAPEMTAKESRKVAYGKVELTEEADLFDNLDKIATPIPSKLPKFMEDYGQCRGYILYRSVIKGPLDPKPVAIDDIHDRAQIFFDGELAATYVRWAPPTKEEMVRLPIEHGKEVLVDVLVENMGRVDYGRKLRDRKGMTALRTGNRYHFDWNAYCLPMEEELEALEFKPIEKNEYKRPTFLRGYLNIEGEPADTFLRLDGFHKGFVKINGKVHGKYFNDAGPQKTLYVPAPFLKEGKNEIIVFESDYTDTFTVEFFDKPDLGVAKLMD